MLFENIEKRITYIKISFVPRIIKRDLKKFRQSRRQTLLKMQAHAWNGRDYSMSAHEFLIFCKAQVQNSKGIMV